MTTESCMTVPLSKAPRVSCPTNNLLAAPRLFAPGGVAPPRHSAHYDSSARLARHENPQADRASYLWDRTLDCMMRDPMACDRFSIAEPNAPMPLHVVEQSNQSADPAGTSDDAPVQADGHHAGPAVVAQSIQPGDGTAAIGTEIL